MKRFIERHFNDNVREVARRDGWSMRRLLWEVRFKMVPMKKRNLHCDRPRVHA